MFYLIYVSSAVTPFTEQQLRATLELSVANNRRDGITGMLLYKDGNFMQVLEGTESIVVSTHARIARDNRHRGLITLLQGPLDGRQFPDWSMGFKNISTDRAGMEGYSEFLNTPLTGHEFSSSPTRAQSLLMSFKRAM